MQGNDSNHCGSCTKACASNQACSSGSCQCTSGAPSACGGCLSWDFESGTQGWGIDTSIHGVNPGAIVTGQVFQSASQHHTGSYSLAFYTQFDGDTVVAATVAVNVCATNVLGLQVTGYVMAVPDPDYSTPPFNKGGVYSDSANGGNDFSISSTNTWIYFTGTFTQSPASITLLGLGLDAGAWHGTIYVDDVMIASP